MSRIALTFSGQVRNIDPSLFNNSLHLFIGNHEADIYLSYWEVGGMSGNHDIDTLTNSSLPSFNINSYLDKAFRGVNIKSKKQFSESDFFQGINKDIKDIQESDKYSVLTINSAKQLYQIHESYMLIDNPQSYDYIVRCRYDSVFVFPFNPDKRIATKHVANINFGRRGAYYEKRIYDIFFYSPSYCAPDVFCKPWVDFSTLVMHKFDNGLDKRDACRVLYLSAKISELDVISANLRYCDVYRNEFKYFKNLFTWRIENSNRFSISSFFRYIKNIIKII